MLAVRPICKPGRARRDGTSVIFIQYCLNSQKRILLNSGIAIPSKFWNKRILKVSALLERQFGEPNELNRQIRDMVRNVEELIESSKISTGLFVFHSPLVKSGILIELELCATDHSLKGLIELHRAASYTSSFQDKSIPNKKTQIFFFYLYSTAVGRSYRILFHEHRQYLFVRGLLF